MHKQKRTKWTNYATLPLSLIYAPKPKLIENYGNGPMTVQTAAKNLPALALYAKFGFVEIKRWTVGVEALELVRLLRPVPSKE